MTSPASSMIETLRLGRRTIAIKVIQNPMPITIQIILISLMGLFLSCLNRLTVHKKPVASDKPCGNETRRHTKG